MVNPVQQDGPDGEPQKVTLIPIEGSPCIMRARIADDELDKPIRRIFPLWLLQRAIRLKQLTLASPRAWEDPNEDMAALCMMQPKLGLGIPFKQKSLSEYLAPAWAQCWSLNPGSNTLLRAYSRVILDPIEPRNVDPRNEGATVTSTPRRLIRAIAKWAAEQADCHFVIGKVTYKPGSEIGQDIANIVNGEDGPNFFKSIQGRAESLLWKRDYFRHEEEVRVIALQRGGKLSSDKFKSFQFDPNDVFTDLSFDPRLKEFERREREEEIKRLGYTGSVTRDLSYMGTLFQLEMLKDWPDP